MASTTVGRIMNKAGVERVSDEAREEMVKELEEYASEAARKAVEATRYVGRKTTS
ncbi:MAG: histone [Halobacteriota archaeon]